jgi:hypothetical protein
MIEGLPKSEILKAGEEPPVIAAVVYNGESAWEARLDASELSLDRAKA